MINRLTWLWEILTLPLSWKEKLVGVRLWLKFRGKRSPPHPMYIIGITHDTITIGDRPPK